MVLGTLSLFQKRGIFYTDQELLAKDSFTKIIIQELSPNTGLKIPDIPNQTKLIPVDEDGDADYITATYQDNGQAIYPYQVTVWLLTEEVNMPIME